jgi:uncharacterized radical SAM superfamily protein
MMNSTAGMGYTGGISSTHQCGMSSDEDELEAAKDRARKIGPFSFDIDDDIDTEVLNNEQVYDDLKELEDILEDGNKTTAHVNLGKSKKKR